MSSLTTRLLAAVDYGEVAQRRRSNFAALHQQLRRVNTIGLALDDPGDAPLCYPLLTARPVDRVMLRNRGLFVPIFWPELIEGGGAECERDLAARLLPLPIDQRYGAAEMQTIADTILQVLP